MPDPPTGTNRPTLLPLARRGRRLAFERHLQLWLFALAAPTAVSVGCATWILSSSTSLTFTITTVVLIAWALISATLFDQIIRPLQTLANIVAALREDDFSLRARGGRHGDALGDLSLEINSLAITLQNQRTSALDALTLVERVLSSMQSPVLAFDAGGNLRLHNAAAATAFPLIPATFTPLLETVDQGLYPAAQTALTRWSVRRTTFRLQGIPHTLLVLSDVSAALREEERTAWQRLIRVLGHEINNSLTPIQSIAGTLRTRLTQPAPIIPADFIRGLTVIEDRSASLNRFLQAYQRLSRLPAPTIQPVALESLIATVATLELRLPLQIKSGPPCTVPCDPDQIQQALINLLQNAVDAALDPEADPARQTPPSVSIQWQLNPGELVIHLDDNGPGITNPGNLFVPFYTTKPQGSGIGLALVRGIVSAHGGQISLIPNPSGHGCRAELLLPL